MGPMIEASELLPRIERFLEATGCKPSRFGRDAAGDSRFVFDLRDGREPRRRVRERVVAALEQLEAEHAANGADRAA